MGSSPTPSLDSAPWPTSVPIEYAIACARLALAMVALIAFHLDPLEMAQFGESILLTLTIYSIFALAVLSYNLASAIDILPLPASKPINSWLPILSFLIDIVIATVLMALSNGATSPFFIFFNFILFAATLRWRASAVLATTVTLVAVLVMTSGGLPNAGENLNRFILRAGYIVIAGALFSYIGAILGRGHARLTQPFRSLAVEGSDDETTLRSLSRFNASVFIIASLVSAILLVSIVAIPQWLIKHARWDDLRKQVGEVAKLATSVIDGDLHRRLLNSANYSNELYAQALKPLVKFHNANPDIFYVYTMADLGGAVHFVLDTAASPELRTSRQLEASPYMERFELAKEYQDNWLQQIASGKTYVTPLFQQDDYGTFLTGHAPIYDRLNTYVGFVGIDYDVSYYIEREARYRTIEIATIVVAVILALGIGYVVSLFYSILQQQLSERERARIARDIHDGILQTLTAAELRLKATTKTANPEMRTKLDETRRLLVETQKQLRYFVEDARFQPRKQSFRLGEEINPFLEKLRRQWNCEITSVVKPKNLQIPVEVAANLRLLVAEAVANAVKHGEADRVAIRFEHSPGTLNVSISDNGSGFSGLSGSYQNELLSTQKKGPRSIYERVKELGGHMALFTSPDGARLEIQLPLI